MNMDMHDHETSKGALIGAMRESGWTMRSIASVVILTFGGLVTSPAVAAVKQEVQKIQWHKADSGNAAKLSTRLLDIRDQLRTATRSNLKGASFSGVRKQFKDDAVALADLDKQTLADFANTRAMIKDKHLPDVIMQRETAAEKHYKTEMAALRHGLDSVVNEKDDAKAQADSKYVLDRLSKFQMERSQQKFDPKNLPNRSLKPDLTRKPFTTKKQFAEAGFIGNPRLMVATTAPNFDYSQLPGANNPAYLAATTEVTLSPAIQAQAAALNYNPVQIYNWVRNNIQWQPTWGAVQDADLTLSAQRGNAFDISSLLIALLRASNIPARYVLGTIDVPADKFRNWVGGFQDINAAVNYASAGGIPITSLYAGGQITTIQMQHIWVEAAIDYMPSHGAINKSADTWVSMDASYKQYAYQKGLDPVAISGLNVGALAQQYTATAQVGSDGWVSNLDPSILDNAQQSAENALQAYLTKNMPNASVTDIIGGRKITLNAVSIFSASLPYSMIVVGARYGALPSQLEQSITFSIGVDATGEPLNPITFPWPQINNQQVTLSFIPATDADSQALLSLLPNGQITDISQLPTSIPAYLINVIPQLEVGGQVVSTAPSMTLGQDAVFYFTPNFAGRYSIPNTYDVTAGSYLDVAVFAGNVSVQKIDELQAAINSTETTLATNNIASIQGLTRDRLLGDMFDVGLSGYYSQYTNISEAIGLGQGGHHYLAAGIGSFGFEPTVKYVFGVPQSIQGGGVVMNVPIVNVIGFDGTNAAEKSYYAMQIGILSSALENAVPEHMFSTSAGSVSAISAVKALELANSAGQKIYHITQSNESLVLPLIHANSSAIQEMSDALSSGKEVITHTDAVSVPGWTGTGYIIFDPATGDGAYKISGGQNGSWLLLGLLIIGIMMLLAALPLFAEVGAPFLALAPVGPWQLAYIAFQEFLLFLDALKFASLNEQIAVSKCSDAQKAQMSKDLTTYLLLQLVTVGMGAAIVSQSTNDIDEFIGEAISFTGNVGGYKVMDTLVDSRTEQEMSTCQTGI